ncbi:unnamed protein product [Callosobruchus maculatus]|uniref:Uncharacterized protein n=1 Tax=Callosobruchus maculatus TaxID=64391 RepID=A0A653BY62_CALMS|nr:unnamed protein product [Callosobruchus maculatus]
MNTNVKSSQVNQVLKNSIVSPFLIFVLLKFQHMKIIYLHWKPT